MCREGPNLPAAEKAVGISIARRYPGETNKALQMRNNIPHPGPAARRDTIIFSSYFMFNRCLLTSRNLTSDAAGGVNKNQKKLRPLRGHADTIEMLSLVPVYEGLYPGRDRKLGTCGGTGANVHCRGGLPGDKI